MPRILVVDDDRLIRSLLTSIFEMHGVACVAAAGGEEALHRLETEEFDLVLLDLMMPGVSGFDVLDAMRSLPPPHPPVMIATAASPAVIERVERSRVAAILAKPFDVDELIATTQELVRRAPRRRRMQIVRLESAPRLDAPLRRPRVSFE